MTSKSLSFCRRAGITNPLVVVLLAGILIALIVLIVVLSIRAPTNPWYESRQNGELRENESAHRGQFHRSKPIKAVGDPNRIKNVLQTGKTYEVMVKVGVNARVEDKDYGIRTVTNIAYAAEAEITRKIEANDGHRIVELRTIVKSRNAKILSEVDNVRIDLGAPGAMLLGAIEYVQPGSTEAIGIAKPLVEGWLKYGAQEILNDRKSKAFAHVDALSGKTVRLVYRDDGSGMESITPVGCSLTPDERDFIASTAVLADCYFLPDLQVKAGATWSVDGSQLGGLMDPSIRSVPVGALIIRRANNTIREGKQIAELAVEVGHLELDTSDASTRRIGSLVPRGKLQYNITDGFVETASLSGDLKLDEVSKDHLLFEASFRTQPQAQISYSCRILP